MFCITLFGRILCRFLKYIGVVEYVLKLGGEEGSELVSLYIPFEGDIDENVECKNTVYGIKIWQEIGS